MRQTLRRSCSACAKAKHACDLRTPKCSRCVKRNCSCAYANEPLTSKKVGLGSHDESQVPAGLGLVKADLNEKAPPDPLRTSMFFETHLFDPFESYPITNLPRRRVQHLMQHFLSKIAFQYYPLDLNPASNPFIISWWPLALNDPALFHVTLQTASLDEEFQARNGFPHSELLMRDSVSLLRWKLRDQSLALQDATMNAVVTLAAIEHGKGNLQVSKMHIDGVKAMVNARGGLSTVKETSPLTARMVPWVSMLVTCSPQFETQDDFGRGQGLRTIPPWNEGLNSLHSKSDSLMLDDIDLDPSVKNTLIRLHSTLGQNENSDILPTTDLHDLTCFVLHRLLGLPPLTGADSRSVARSECLRYGTSIYMFIVHGPTYYSHAAILESLVLQFRYHLEALNALDGLREPLLLWLFSVGAVACGGTYNGQWFNTQVAAVSTALGIRSWDEVEAHLKSVLWLERSRVLFQQTWEEIIASSALSKA